MSYGLLGVQNQLESQAIQGLQQTAQIQQENKRAEDAMEMAEKQQRTASVGMGASIGMMAGAKSGSVGGPAGAAIGAFAGWALSELM